VCVRAFVCRDVFPASRSLFLYRDILTTAKSMYRMSMILPYRRLTYLLGRLTSRVSRTTLELLCVADRHDLCMRFDNDMMHGVLLSSLITSRYLDLRRRGFDVSAVRYEDLVARPLDMCRILLDFCHLPQSLAERAVRAFDVDAQRNSALSKSVIGHLQEPPLTPETKTKLNELLKKCGTPLIGEPDVMEGTLFCEY